MIYQQKIINDPVYGFISIPAHPVFTLLEHKYFQRLRRIKQLGLTHYVYPGALHTRFHHALGAMHLMQETLSVLRRKGVGITLEEEQGALIAILLHDIGHGPYSHALEHTLADLDHESITELMMRHLNSEFSGQLEVAIQIFNGTYHKRYLHQLVSSQLDMDRLDYLKRDSFYTGVAEGVIGHDRIIKMLNVVDDQVVVEEKAIYSIEKFLVARRLMYLQVYLHKTVLSAEHMLKQLLVRARTLLGNNAVQGLPPMIRKFLAEYPGKQQILADPEEFLHNFSSVDDIEVGYTVKVLSYHDDPVLQILSRGLLERTLFKSVLRNTPYTEAERHLVRKAVEERELCPPDMAGELILTGRETAGQYVTGKEDILILRKSGKVIPLSDLLETDFENQRTEKFFLCYPKSIGPVELDA